MEAPVIKLMVPTLTYILSLSRCILVPLPLVTTFLSFVKPTTTRMKPWLRTTGRSVSRSWRRPRSINPGSALSRSTLSSIMTSIHLVGQRMDSQDHRDHTTAELVLARSMGEISSSLDISPILLRSWCWQGLWARYRDCSCQVLHVRRNQGQRHQCRGDASSVGIPGWTL